MSWTFLVFLCIGASSVTAQGARSNAVEVRLRRGYENALDDRKVIHARWTVFAPKSPLEHSESAKKRGGLQFRDPLDNAPVEAVRFCRAWCSAGERVRIETSTPFILGGPEELKWTVWATDGTMHVNSTTLTSKRAEVTPERPLDPKVDDLFNDLEAQCLGVIVHRLIIWARADGTTVESVGPDECMLRTKGGEVRVEWIPGTNALRTVRYRLKAAPKDLAIEYQYGDASVRGIFPSDHPTTSRVNLLEPDQPLGASAWVIRFNEVSVDEVRDTNRFTWQSIASSARRTDTNEVLRVSGDADPAKTFAMRTQQTFEPLKHTEDPPPDGSLPKAIDKTPAWSRWLLVGGITSIVLAVGLVLRRRAGA
jgi:hypothetical protein